MKSSKGSTNPTMNPTKSIRAKILTVTLLVLLALSMLLGASSIAIVNNLSRSSAEQLITQRCGEETIRVENKLNLVRHSVSMVYEYAYELSQANHMDPYSQAFEDQIRDLAVAAAADTEGAMAVYFRYNPEITKSGTSGFFWAKVGSTNEFAEEPPTDILAYDPSDVEHVGWFYDPKAKGAPMWMTPYLNKNLNVFMISYVIPVYGTSGTFIGVLGMDIDFSVIISEATQTQLYQTGNVSVVDLNTKTVYYCDANGAIASKALTQDQYDHFKADNRDTALMETVDIDGKRYDSCHSKLSNGMVLYLSVPLNEINANRDFLIFAITISTLLVCLIAVIIVWKRTSTIVRPIRKLADVADSYARGNWDAHYICKTGDELQSLSESISEMADQTKLSILRLNGLVRFDALTGVRNRTAYIEHRETVIDNHHEDFDEYAVLVLDVNNLKLANDKHGHDAGDALIVETARYICRTFMHSSVFRIGGDEFVAIMLNQDYENRDALLASFEEGMGYDVSGTPLSISYGMATADEAGGNFDEAFKLADDRMYKKKAAMKQATPR